MSRALVLVFLLAACDSPVKPYAPQLDVFCVLRTDDSRPVALVGRSVSYEDWDRAGDWNGVESATVVIAQGKDSTGFRSLPESAGYYQSDSLSVIAGRSYGISVRTPDGDKARGSTIVPGSFHISSISSTADSEQWRVRVAWTASQAAADYLLLVTSVYAKVDGETLYYRRSVSSDSGGAEFSTPLDGYHMVLAAVGISVGALDRNYTDYLTMRNGYGYHNTLMHIDGGLGVFGSICVAETTIYPPQPSSPSTLGHPVLPTR